MPIGTVVIWSAPTTLTRAKFFARASACALVVAIVATVAASSSPLVNTARAAASAAHTGAGVDLPARPTASDAPLMARSAPGVSFRPAWHFVDPLREHEVKRDEHTVTFTNSDGSTTVDSHLHPTSWRAADGSWQPFDQRVRRAGSAIVTGELPFAARIEGDGYSWAPDSNDPGRGVRLDLDWIDEAAGWTVTDGADGVVVQRDGPTTTELDVINSGVKATMRLADSSAPTSWRMAVTPTGGLAVRRDDLVIMDGPEPVGQIVPPFAIDANGVRRDLTWRWVDGDLEMTLDADGLAFPIDVDPTVTYLATATNDVAFEGLFTYPNISCATSATAGTTMRVGWNGAAARSYAFWLRFPGVLIPRGAIIASATASIWEVGTPFQGGSDGLIGFPAGLYAEQVDNAAAWASCANLATRTYSYNNPGGVSGGGTNVFKDWDVSGSATLVTDRLGWASGNAMSFIGFANDLGTGTYWSTYGMSELGANDPKLVVNYTADVTAPAVPTMRDGFNAGIDDDFKVANTSLYTNWVGGTDNYKVRGIDYCFSTSATGADCATTAIVPWTFTNVSWSGNTGLAAIAEGTLVRACGRTEDYAGNNSAVVCSDGVRIDRSTPATTLVRDGTGADIDWDNSLTALDANWTAVVDNWSGLQDYDYCIATGVGCTGTVVRTWTTTGTTPSVSATGLTLVNGTTYYVAVRATDVLGNISTTLSSDGVTIDNVVPPAPAPTNDGAGADLDYQTSLTTLPANWATVVDPASGLARYEYCIATGGSCTGTVARTWTSTGLTASTTGTGLALVSGTTYIVAVRAVDVAGSNSGVSNSDGIMIDTTTPAPATVNDGSGADIDWDNSLTALDANWSAVVDPGSGLQDYDYCISTAASCGGTVVRTWTSTGTTASVSATGLTLVNGTQYFVAVRATDNLGNVSAVTSSDAVRIDTSLPATITTVNDGAGADIDQQASLTTLPANWTASSDTGSGLARYEYCISTAVACGGTVARTWTSTALVTSTTGVGLTLTNNTTYFVAVRAVDVAGNVAAAASSDGILVDNTTPAPATVNDGTAADIDWDNSLAALDANWSTVVDPGSGLNHYDYCISTLVNCGGTVIRTWTSTGTTASVAATGLTLTNGTLYRIAVRAVDNLGTVSAVTNSDGVTIDTAVPPAPAAVNDGPGADIDWDNSLTALDANWSVVVDPASGLARYDYCISTAASCGGTVARTWTSTGTTPSVSATGLALTNATQYFVAVRGVDAAGNLGTVRTSDGVTIDTTAPTSTAPVNDGAGADLDFQSSLTTLPANWAATTETGSGLAQYEYCISTAASCGGTVARTWTSTGTTASTTGTGLTLT
ncbi:MAG: hypothetical protein JWL76_1052, partial [Thermoleophilia bacterium]|nr:hypothetical protein [Thermoleophilia bacterium]